MLSASAEEAGKAVMASICSESTIFRGKGKEREKKRKAIEQSGKR